MKKKSMSMLLSAAMVLSQMSMPVMAADTPDLKDTNVTVTVSSQAGGSYLLPPQTTTINGYLAESYGYPDTVTDGVSTLDALVAQTIEIFGEEDFAASPESYLAVSSTGWITTIFGEETGACAFYVNNEMPVTLINQTVLSDDDNVIFFVYEDKAYYTDRFTLFSDDTPREVAAKDNLELTLLYQGYDSSYNTVLLPLEGASVGILEEDGSISEIADAVTDEEGKVTIFFDNPGSYMITAYGTDDTDSQLISNPIEITVTEEKNPYEDILREINTDVNIAAQAEGAYVLPPQVVTVNGFLAESYGYPDTVTDGASTLDALVAESILIFGEDEFAENPTDYLEVSDKGWITKIFGEATGACGFYVNSQMPSTLINQTLLSDMDDVIFFIYVDKTYYTDRFTQFSDDTPREVAAKDNLEVTLLYQGYDSSYNTVLLPLEGGSIGILEEDGSISEIADAVTDENGKVTISFDAPGTYKITAYGTDDTDSQLISNPIEITVTKEKNPYEDILRKINTDVNIAAQAEGAYVLPPQVVTVNGFLAESYGYPDTVTDGASSLDALVAESILIFGEDEFAENPTAYLEVSDKGWITKIFGEATGACAFYVNNQMPYTLINQTLLSDKDDVIFFIYVDKTYYTDRFPQFSDDTPREVAAKDDLEVTLLYQGYDSSYNTVLLPVEGGSIGILEEDGSISEIADAVTDENGKVTISFEAPGTYKITAYGTDDTDSQLISNPIEITVTEEVDPDAEKKEADKKAADAVIEQIKATNPEAASLEDLKKVQSAYNALTDDQKALVNANADAVAAFAAINAKIAELENPAPPAPTELSIPVGTSFTVKGYKYVVTSNLIENPTVAVKGYKNKKLTKIVIGDTVAFQNVSFKITAIANKAFKSQKKAKSVIIGANVASIGSEAFRYDSKLKKITVKSPVLVKVGKKALGGIYKKAKIKVPAAQYGAYKKLFKNKGQRKSVKVIK